MIAQVRLDDRWKGTWRTGRHKVKPGDVVIVPTGGNKSLRIGTVLAVGKTRKAVGCTYTGRLKTIRRLATYQEHEAWTRIRVMREMGQEYLNAAQKASVDLAVAVRRS